MIVAIVALLLGRPGSGPIVPGIRLQILTNLKVIGLAIGAYQDSHNGNFPPDFESLVPEFVSLDGVSVFFDPKDHSMRDTAGQDLTAVKNAIHQKSIYKLVPPPHDGTSLPEEEVVAYELPNFRNDDTDGAKGTRSVLYADLHVSTMLKAQCEKLGFIYRHDAGRH